VLSQYLLDTMWVRWIGLTFAVAFVVWCSGCTTSGPPPISEPNIIAPFAPAKIIDAYFPDNITANNTYNISVTLFNDWLNVDHQRCENTSYENCDIVCDFRLSMRNVCDSSGHCDQLIQSTNTTTIYLNQSIEFGASFKSISDNFGKIDMMFRCDPLGVKPMDCAVLDRPEIWSDNKFVTYSGNCGFILDYSPNAEKVTVYPACQDRDVCNL
jgi:hypothetical protein